MFTHQKFQFVEYQQKLRILYITPYFYLNFHRSRLSNNNCIHEELIIISGFILNKEQKLSESPKFIRTNSEQQNSQDCLVLFTEEDRMPRLQL